MPRMRPKLWSTHPIKDEIKTIQDSYRNTDFKGKTSRVLFKAQYHNDFKDKKFGGRNRQSIDVISTKVNISDGDHNQEMKKIVFAEKFKEGILYIFNKGSLHGLKYITDPSKSLKERVLWTVMCIISFALCAYNIYSLWFTWHSSPFSIVLDERYTPIFDIPFPHVIICPKNTVKLSVLDLSNVTDKSVMFVASLFCGGMESSKYSLPEKMSHELEKQLNRFIVNSTPTCSETIKACKWMSQDGYEEYTEDCCATMFHPVLTNNGACFGFNMMTSLPKSELMEILGNHQSSGTEHDGYPPHVLPGANSAYPRRAFNNGEKFGLWVELYVNTSETQEICDGAEFGFKIIVDSPMESVLTSNFAKIPMERQTTFAVRPSKVTTDPEMKKLSPEKRKCFFNDEVKLKFFVFYTLSNCLLECEIKYIVSICMCVPFYFKELLPNITTCSTVAEYSCMKEIKADMTIRTVEEYYGWKNKILSKHIHNAQMFRSSQITACNCYPCCEDINYNLEVFYSDLIRSNTSQIPTWAKVMTKSNEVTRLGIHFKETLFYGTHRQMRYNDMDFLASCGGVLGLFLGFSIVSIFELVYYVFIKPAILTFFLKYEDRSKKAKNAVLPQYHGWIN